MKRKGKPRGRSKSVTILISVTFCAVLIFSYVLYTEITGDTINGVTREAVQSAFSPGVVTASSSGESSGESDVPGLSPKSSDEINPSGQFINETVEPDPPARSVRPADESSPSVQSSSGDEFSPHVQSSSNDEPAPPVQLSSEERLSQLVPSSQAEIPSAPTVFPTPTPDSTIVICGDILLADSVGRLIESDGRDAVFSPESRAPFVNADIAFANLEMPISLRGAPMPDKEYTYRGDPEHARLLSEMGLDIVSLANNHTIDYGRGAFADTLYFLDEVGIEYVGGGRDKDEAMRWESFGLGDGKTVAFLAASRVIPVVDWYAGKEVSGLFGTYDPAELNGQITAAKAEHDYVIVYVHWGVERNPVPEDWQRNQAKGYILAGADLVVGSHPHILQGFEFFQEKLIAYSLGNFIFTDGAKDTGALEVTVSPEGEFAYRLLPYEIVRRSTGVMSDEGKLKNLRQYLSDISFGVEVTDGFEIIIQTMPTAG